MKDMTEEFDDGLGEPCLCDTDFTCLAAEHDAPISAVSGSLTTAEPHGARIEVYARDGEGQFDFYAADGTRMPDDPTDRRAWFRRSHKS